MPWKLLFFIIVLALVVTFVGLNVGNTSDISFGFHTFTDVPIFVSLFAAFLIGVLVTLPATLWSSKRGGKTPKLKRGRKREEPVALPARSNDDQEPTAKDQTKVDKKTK